MDSLAGDDIEDGDDPGGIIRDGPADCWESMACVDTLAVSQVADSSRRAQWPSVRLLQSGSVLEKHSP